MKRNLVFRIDRISHSFAGPSMEIVRHMLLGNNEIANELLQYGEAMYGRYFSLNTRRFVKFIKRHKPQDHEEVVLIDNWL